MSSFVEKLDAQIAELLADWSIISTVLALVIVAFVAYPVIFPEEPDTHPLLLARQAQPSPVRNKNESGVYRSPETPHGYPLRSGLNVKEASAPKWASGKDGDVRDIWREVQRGGTTGTDGKPIPQGLIMTIFGKEDAVEHDISDLTNQIAILGKQLKAGGAKRVAIYLPNSIEYLLTVFACAFYGLSPILLPYNQPHPKLFELLNTVEADGLVCAAGSIPLDDIAASCTGLRQLVWVVEKTSRHMDWNGVPEAGKGRLSVNVWHDVVEENKSASGLSLPTNDESGAPGDLVSVWQAADPNANPEIVTFTQGNLVAAVSALSSALPLRQRFNPGDLILPANSFAHNFILCQTLAALFAHSSLAINSVAEPGVDLKLAARSVSPTVILASAETLAALHNKETAGISNTIQRVGKYSQAQAMSAGRMPTDTLLFRLFAPSTSAAGDRPGTLRLILTSERIGLSTPALSSSMLSDLRIFTKARIVYALTAAGVAGAISQTNVFDYRQEGGAGHAHFGVPLSSLEVKVVTKDDATVAGSAPEGSLVVSGPAVSGAGGSKDLGVRMKIREDGTLAYA